MKPAQLEISQGTGSIDLLPFGNLKGKAVVKGLPEFKITQRRPLRFQVFVENLVPRATWWLWSYDLKGFLAEFIQLKINEALNSNLPPLEVPFENFIKIDQREEVKDIPVFDGAYTAKLTTPPFSWGTTFSKCHRTPSRHSSSWIIWGYRSNTMTYILLYLIYITILVLSGCGPTEVESNRVSVKLPEPLQAALEKPTPIGHFWIPTWRLGFVVKRLLRLSTRLTSIAENNRRIMLQLSTEHRKLAQEPNYYVELYDLPNNVAIGTLRNLTTAWSEQEHSGINSALGVDGTIKLHGHYNPLAVGGHIGFRLNAEGTLRGKIVFTADPQELLAVSFQLLPSRVSYSGKPLSRIKKSGVGRWTFHLVVSKGL